MIGQACLEFQWHHHVPSDIVVKGLFESCADLNLVGGCSLAIQYCWGSSFGADKLALAACGFKLLTAYFGQFRCLRGLWVPHFDPARPRLALHSAGQPHARPGPTPPPPQPP